MRDFGNWVAGFIDGEGCFYIRHAGGSYAPIFRLKVRDDDRPILDEIVRRTGIGYVKRTPSRNQVEWMVCNKRDCQKLARFLQAHPLRAKKARDFAIWTKALTFWSGVKTISAGWHAGTTRHPNQAMLAGLKQELEHARAYRNL
jgi:hypothetical protein